MVVGVVEDMRDGRIEEDAAADASTVRSRRRSETRAVPRAEDAVRSGTLRQPLAAEVRAVDPDLPTFGIRAHGGDGSRRRRRRGASRRSC